MDLLESEQRGFRNDIPQGTFFDDAGETKLIEDLVGYLPTEHKEFNGESENLGTIISQKPKPPSYF